MLGDDGGERAGGAIRLFGCYCVALVVAFFRFRYTCASCRGACSIIMDKIIQIDVCRSSLLRQRNYYYSACAHQHWLVQNDIKKWAMGIF